MRLWTRRDDRGVTLIEVLIVIVLLGIIAAPIAGALIGFLRNTNQLQFRLAESHDAQISSAYFAQDVQSIGVHDWTAAPYPLKPSVEQNVAATGGTYPCGTASTPNAVLRLAWDDPAVATGTPSYVVVSYVVQVVGTEQQLRRLRCVNSSSTISSDIIIAHNLVSAPVATCATAAGVPQSCAGLPVPQIVSLPLTVRKDGNTGNALTVTLVGQRRQT
jgi:prepilin-type N-terminal cleavage/methylation domain-containing protein